MSGLDAAEQPRLNLIFARSVVVAVYADAVAMPLDGAAMLSV